MLGIEDYGSDVESDGEDKPQASMSASPPPNAVPSSSTSQAPKHSSSTFCLPSPKNSSQSLKLPPPSNGSEARVSSARPSITKPKQTKKILLNLPLPEINNEEDEPAAKRPRITTSGGRGAHTSSLLGMLPAPKQPLPVKEKKAERVLGGGGGSGLVFRAAKSADPKVANEQSRDAEEEKEDMANDSPSRVSGAPAGRKAAAVDFFSLGSSSTSIKPTPPTLSNPPSMASSAPTTSAAPSIPTFRPPSPTLDDPYPGYYQLPSGAYAPYDTDYYASYARKWKADYDKQIRALESSQYTPQTEDMQDVDMASEMEKARREIKMIEERKSLTAGKSAKNTDGEPEMPKMNIKGATLGGVARTRHQLTTLLTDAYLNRDALEEKIAQARRNRKEAGNKYGF